METDSGMEIIVDMKQSDAKFAVNVGQLKSSDAAAGTEPDAFEDGAVPTYSEDADDDAFEDDDMFDDDMFDDDMYDPEEDEEVEAEDHGSFIRNFYYGQIPQFVIDEFGLTPDIMEKNKA